MTLLGTGGMRGFNRALLRHRHGSTQHASNGEPAQMHHFAGCDEGGTIPFTRKYVTRFP